MATVSFDKKFVVADDASAMLIRHGLENPRPIFISSRDKESDEREGLSALKRKLSRLKASS